MSHIEDIVKRTAKDKGFTDVKVEIEKASKMGDNFVGDILRVKIYGVVNEKQKTMQVVVKSAPVIAKNRNELPMRLIFLREIQTYKDVLPILDSVQKQMPENERYKFAKCYAFNTENTQEMLVMEDLMLQEFKMHKPRLDTLDFDHLSISLAALAKFHAISYALEIKNPQTFRKIADQATNFLFTEWEDSLRKYNEIASENVMKCVEDEETKQRLARFSKKVFNISKEMLKPAKYSVLCHGDYWKNNILFKYENGKPIQICALDYQLFRYASPVTDIVYLLFNCSSQYTRRKHFWELINVYHNTLGQQLERMDVNVEKVFPKAEFFKEIKRVGAFGLASAITVLLFMTCATDEIPDVSEVIRGKAKTQHENSESFQLYKERMRGIIEDTMEYGFDYL